MTTYYVDPGNTNVTAWQANHVYSEGDYVCPTDLTTADAKSVYECTTGGTSHASTEPTWDETAGNTTSDGTVTWTARAPDSWDEALLSLQPAADLATAGDTVYCRGTQNLSAAIDFDTNSGTYDGGYIKFIGCNASGENDGTRFTLKRTSNTINGIYIAAVHYVWLENFSIEGCTANGIAQTNAYADHWQLVNVRCYNNTTYGLNNNGYGRYWNFVRCEFVSNGSHGIHRSSGSFFCCTFSDNGGYGAFQVSACNYVSCIFHNNTNHGVYFYGGGAFVNNVVDGNAGGGVLVNHTIPTYLLCGCRITNNGASKVGVDITANVRTLLIGCYFQANTTHVTAGKYDVVSIDGSTTHVVLGGTDTDGTNGELLGGYKDIGNDDFNLKATATLRSQAIELD